MKIFFCKYYRFVFGCEVCLCYGYFIICVDVVKDLVIGVVVEFRCTYDSEICGGYVFDG